MVKKRVIFIGIIVLIISSFNLYLYFNKGRFSYSALSGGVITEIPKIPANLDISTIVFLLQWVIILFIIIIIYAFHLKHKKEEAIKINCGEMKKKRGKSSTDLDIFYQILKDKKRLKLGTISRTFKISKEKALEWAKILEDHELVIIEYPAFNDPEVTINEKTQEKKI